MNTNKILSAPLIDVIFDGRNKAYGAYELRKTYSKREKKALSITISVVAFILCGVTLANSSKKKNSNYKIGATMEIAVLKDKKPPEKLPEPEKKQVETRTEKFTEIVIVDKEDIKPPPSVDDLDSALIGFETKAGKPDSFIADEPKGPIDEKGILDTKKEPESNEPFRVVEVEAKFIGNWQKFLLKNLNPETPVEHDAPEGRYSVVIEFVVDKEGNVSDIKPLTTHGYGLEEEAVRVLKKATKWEPAIQNGYKVKAYHRQVIVFEVNPE